MTVRFFTGVIYRHGVVVVCAGTKYLIVVVVDWLKFPRMNVLYEFAAARSTERFGGFLYCVNLS